MSRIFDYFFLPLPNIRLKPLLIILHVRIPPFRLGHYSPSDSGPEQITGGKNPQHIREADDGGAAQVVEEESG